MTTHTYKEPVQNSDISSTDADCCVTKPLGIPEEELTDDYLDHLHDIKFRRPELWHTMMCHN